MRYLIHAAFVMLILTFLSPAVLLSEEYEVGSPSGDISCVVEMKDGVPFYTIEFKGREVLRDSRMGMILEGGTDLSTALEVINVERRGVDTTWIQPWGESREVRDSHNELSMLCRPAGERNSEIVIVFRVFDDGAGFRYELSRKAGDPSFKVIDEKTEFALPSEYTAWWIPAYENNRYEYLYTESSTSGMRAVHTPLTMQTPEGDYVSIHEAALTNWASMVLVNMGNGVLECDLVPWSDGTRVKGEMPASSPWRTVTVSEDAAGLITSTIVLNLNEPSRIEDTSWIRPGKYVGIWWGMHIGKYSWGSGSKHGATTRNTKMYIDFAARHGFDGVLVEGWNLGWDNNWYADGSSFRFTIPHPDFDMYELSAYAREKGVYLIGHHETGADIDNYERQLDSAFEYYEKHGVKAVKTGYVGHRTNEYEWHHGQYMVEHYRRVVEKAAEHQIMVIVHEPIKATGIRRTWPNMISREGARGQEYNAWAGDGGNPPGHTTVLPFTRMLGGPFDFTPGIFDLHFEEANRPDNRVNTTLAKQLALYVVIYSPMQMAADLPEKYEGHPAFAFIKAVPSDWETTEVLHAKVGDYVTIARKERGGDDWFIGSITDEEGRTLEAGLSFLDPDVEYEAQVFADGAGADWRHAPYRIEIISTKVDYNSRLELELAPGGGQAVWISPADQRR